MNDAFLLLLARARAGNPEACDRIARILYPPVRRMLTARFCRQPRDALEDLTQEAMARIIRLLPTCHADTERRFYAWAYRAAMSAALNHLVAPGAESTVLAARFISLDAPLLGPFGGPAGDTAPGTDAPAVLGDALADADALAEVLARVDGTADVALDAGGSLRGDEIDGGAPADGMGSVEPTTRDLHDVRLQRLAVHVYRELPDAAQGLLWLRLVEGAEWADLGRELGITGAAVKRRFERVCARLARDVAERLLGGPLAPPTTPKLGAPERGTTERRPAE